MLQPICHVVFAVKIRGLRYARFVAILSYIFRHKRYTMGNRLLVFLIAFLILLPDTLAFEWEITCQDNTTLRKFMNFTSCNATACEQYNISQFSSCEFGCDTTTETCRKAKIYEYADYFTAIVVLLTIVGGLILLFRRVK